MVYIPTHLLEPILFIIYVDKHEILHNVIHNIMSKYIIVIMTVQWFSIQRITPLVHWSTTVIGSAVLKSKLVDSVLTSSTEASKD